MIGDPLPLRQGRLQVGHCPMQPIGCGHLAFAQHIDRSILLEFGPDVRHLLVGQHPVVPAFALVIQSLHAVASILGAPAQE